MQTGGDEYGVAVQLGVTKAFVEIPLALGFVACLILGLRELPSWRVRFIWLGTAPLSSIAIGLPMAMADSLVSAQVNAGNTWFQPVIGYSLPVFLVNGLALIGVGIGARWQENVAVPNVPSAMAP